jgi:HlyD family secretion protein
MRFVRWLIPFALAAAAVLPAVQLPKRLRGITPPPAVPTLSVEPDTFVVGVTAEHVVEGCKDTRAVPRGTRGKLSYIVEDGTRVKEGDVIARLDTKDLQREFEEARLAYSNAQSEVAQAERDRNRDVEQARYAVEQAKRELEVLLKANATELEENGKELEHKRILAESARLEYDRQKRLGSPEVGLVSRSEVEQAQRALRNAEFAVTTAGKALEFLKKQHASKVEQKKNDVADAEYKLKTAEDSVKPGIEAARYSIESRKERLDRVQERLEEATIKAPASGVVVVGMTWDRQTMTTRPYQVGDEIGGRGGLATITDMSCLQVRLPVEQSRIASVKVGQEALLTFVALPGRTYHGVVGHISPSARRADPWDDPNLAPGTTYFTVTVSVKDPDARLRPGLQCKVQIVFQRLRKVLAVPVPALVRKGGRDIVYVRNGNGFAARNVEIGDRNEEAVVIKKGLKSGEVVALQDPTGQSQL